MGELRAQFVRRSEAKIETAARLLGLLRERPTDPQHLQELMRFFHSLAGVGTSFGFPQVTALAKEGELECLALLHDKAAPSTDRDRELDAPHRRARPRADSAARRGRPRARQRPRGHGDAASGGPARQLGRRRWRARWRRCSSQEGLVAAAAGHARRGRGGPRQVAARRPDRGRRARRRLGLRRHRPAPRDARRRSRARPRPGPARRLPRQGRGHPRRRGRLLREAGGLEGAHAAPPAPPGREPDPRGADPLRGGRPRAGRVPEGRSSSPAATRSRVCEDPKRFETALRRVPARPRAHGHPPPRHQRLRPRPLPAPGRAARHPARALPDHGEPDAVAVPQRAGRAATIT